MPHFPETSTLRSPRDPDVIARSHYKHNDVGFNLTSIVHAVRQIQGQLNRLRIIGGNGIIGSGWDWMYDPKELDPSLPYDEGKFVYISALNPLITDGMTDIVSNTVVTSCQGIWQALQDIPAAVGGKFNVPTIDYPSGAATVGGSAFAPGTTAPSGTPLVGDMDLVDPTTGKPVRFWQYWGDIT